MFYVKNADKQLSKCLKCLDSRLPVPLVLVAVVGLFLAIGTSISLVVEQIIITYLFYLDIYNQMTIIGFIALVIFGLFCVALLGIFFLKLSQYYAKLNFLPHFFLVTNNRSISFAHVVPLFIAVVVQVILHSLSSLGLVYSILFGFSVFISLYASAKFLEFYDKISRLRYATERFRIALMLILTFIVGICACVLIVLSATSAIKYYAFSTFVVYIAAFGFMYFSYVYYSKIIEKTNVQVQDIHFARPHSIRAFVIISKMSKPNIRAISYSRVRHPNLEILRISDKNDFDFKTQWQKSGVDVPLRLVKSSCDIATSLKEYFDKINAHPEKDLIVVYIPHLVTKQWWEKWYHNRISTKIIKKLETIPGIVIASVPWQI